jgi:O-antigen/teichoic acid export membrane protein
VTQSAGDSGSATRVDAIRHSAVRGLVWSLGGTILSRFGGLALGLVLARILAPSDFGLYAVAVAATQFVMMVKDVGVIAATMHWRGPLDEMTPTASTLALVSSTTLYAIFWVGAPAFSSFAGNPEAAPVVRLLTAVILVEGVTAVRSGVLMREFRQDRLVVANLCGLAVNAAVAVTLAISGAGAMSFAAGQVAGAVVIGAIVFISAAVPVRLGWDGSVAARLLRYGIPLAAGLALEAVLLNADFVIIGRLLSAEVLGYYLLAFNISSWALTTITASLRYVSVAGFSRLSEMDAEVLSRSTQRSMVSLYQLAIPIGVLTAVLAMPIVALLYGPSWIPAASVLRFLAVLTVVRVLISFAMDILMGVGSTKAMLWVNAVWAAALIPALYVGVERYGIRGAGIAHAVVAVAVACPLAIWALRRVGIRLSPILPKLVRPTMAAVAAGGSARVASDLVGSPAILDLAVAGVAGLATYVLIAFPYRDLSRWSHAALLRLRREADLDHVSVAPAAATELRSASDAT